MKTRLVDVAKVIRSKNAGPFELTFDILFRNSEDFNAFRQRDILNESSISRLFQIEPDDVLSIIYYEPVHAVKFTIKREKPSGAPGDTDIYGAQQHAPLLDVEWQGN